MFKRTTLAIFLTLALLLLSVPAALAATPTATALALDTSTPAYGGSVRATATIAPAVAGRVNFYLDAAYVTTVGVVNGKATATIALGSSWGSNQPLGAHSVTAEFIPTNVAYDPSSASAPFTIVAAPATLQWGSERQVVRYGNPANPISYGARGYITVRQGNIRTARVIVRDEDADAIVCDVGVVWLGPYQAMWSCAIPLYVGPHRLSAQVYGNYTSPVVEHNVTITIR